MKFGGQFRQLVYSDKVESSLLAYSYMIHKAITTAPVIIVSASAFKGIMSSLMSANSPML